MSVLWDRAHLPKAGLPEARTDRRIFWKTESLKATRLEVAQNLCRLHALVLAVLVFQALLDALGIFLQARDVRAHLPTCLEKSRMAKPVRLICTSH